jgi:PAS domain S-box-containing protein
MPAKQTTRSALTRQQFIDVDPVLLRTLLDKLPVAAYTCDAQGLITYFNQHSIELWGRAPKLNDPTDRFCGSFKLYALDGTPIRHDECWMAQALLRNKEYLGQEILIERPDGSRLAALAHASPIRDSSGLLVGAINLLVDISDRKRAEEVQALMAAIVQSSDDAIVSKSLEGVILSWNAGAERLFGYTPEEAIGKSITLVIPPERYTEEEAILARLRRGERIEHYETVRVAKDGRRLDLSLTVSPVRDSSGRIIAASKVARDVTLQKRAQEAHILLKDELAAQLADLRRLHEMSVRLATTLELQPILDETLRTAVAIEDADMGIVSICDVDKGELHIGANLGFRAEFLKAFEPVPTGGATGICFAERRRVIVEDAEIDPIFAPFRDIAREAGFRAVHCTPLITRAGRVIGVLATHFRRPHRPSDRETHLIDLCARQAAEFIENARLYDELIEADRRKDEFLATLAHELRNPLAPISNSLQILRLSDDLSPGVEQVREIMERQVNHMVRLVDDLMEVSRITRGKVELRKERVELAAIVRGAVETSRPLIESAGHQLAISVSPEPMTLEADQVRLAQVIANLLNNAAKYTDRGGQIWLTAKREGGQAIVSVRDTGLGIPAEMLPRVFDMFAQVDRTLKRSQGGLGIGLTLAKRLVQMHGGQIDVFSEGPGKGSEFVVRLPLVADIGIVTTSIPTLPSRPINLGQLATRRILVIDDARDSVYVLSKLLTRMGQDVQVTQDAEEGLEMARKQPPDVIISDIGMPKMDGYELARRLRQEPAVEKVVLVALTGYGQETDKQKAKDAGFDYHLTKPVGLEALEELLSSLPFAAESKEKESDSQLPATKRPKKKTGGIA